jgi:hypothetical protein
MLLTLLTFLHVAISLVGIGAGLVVVFGLIESRRSDTWTALFLATTAATSLTGFFFPFHGFKPSMAVGGVSLVLLALTAIGRYRFEFSGAWRGFYVFGVVSTLYLNVFVLIIQMFLKIPALQALAPTQTEAPFKISQLSILIAFILVGIVAAKRFRVERRRE